MTLARRVVDSTLHRLTGFSAGWTMLNWSKMPEQGHSSWLPIMSTFWKSPCSTRTCGRARSSALTKAETWHSPVMGWLFDLSKAIPVRRGEADTRPSAARLASPGSWPHSGSCAGGHAQRRRTLAARPSRRGDAGVAQRRAPVADGLLRRGSFWRNLPRLRRTDFHVVVGNRFTWTLTEPSDARGAPADD